MRILNTLAYMVLICITTFLQAQEQSTNFESIFSEANSSARLQHVRSALDPVGKIHLVFTGDQNQLYYGTNKGGGWSFEKLHYVDEDYNDTIGVAKYPNIAIDNDNTIHVTVFDRYGEKLYYASRPSDGEDFNFKAVETSPKIMRFYVYGEYSDMAIDKQGGLHLLCQADYTDQNEFKYNMAAIYFYKSAHSSEWQIQVLVYDNEMYDEHNWFSGHNSSITCHEEKVYAAIGGSNKLHFGSKDISGNSWEIEELIFTPDEFINSGKDNLSLAISPGGTIKFAFYERTDDEESTIHGLSIYSRNTNCGSKEWMVYNGWEKPLVLNAPALGFNDEGKAYLALGKGGFTLYEQTCDCDSKYKMIFHDENNSGLYSDMIIDKQNTVHCFFTSDYDSKLYHLAVKTVKNNMLCNYPPLINAYSGKTNVGPGENWTGTVSATDYECDKIDFYSIILPDYITLENHGNGTATITAKIPEGEGFGDVGFTLFARDAFHQDIDNNVSAITFMLKLTQEGNKEGHVTVENKCGL